MSRWGMFAAAALTLSLVSGGAAAAQPAGHTMQARGDTYRVPDRQTLTIGPGGLFRNDSGEPTALVAHTAPAHGTVSVDPDGSFRYTPADGFTGTDRFTYTVTNAVRLYQTHLPPLATIGGVPITGGGYGSALARVPGSPDEYYGLTDRGPNVDGPDGEKVLPLPKFDPSIGRFRLTGDKAVLEKVIPLRAADGTPYNGLVNPQASTGEKLVDLNGEPLPTDPDGYDSEGLVAMPDGTF
jgi:Bacterial Ig domain